MRNSVRLPYPLRIGVPAAVLFAALAYSLHDPAAAKPAKSILYDPGPSLRCYSVSVETTGENYGNDHRGCNAIDSPWRENNEGCKWFNYVSDAGRRECPAWRFINYGWPKERLGKYPGYDHQVKGASGSPLQLVMQNNSRTEGSCDLKEMAFSYEYIGSSIRRKESGETYNFADGPLKVSYDAFARKSGGFTCNEKRAILTTDLIYHVPGGGKDVISVVHYDPGHFMTPNADGVLWTNKCAGSVENGKRVPGCRITVPGQQIQAGKTTRVSVDFTGLAKKYRKYLHQNSDRTGPPKESAIDSVQIVNSTKGADLETRVSHADVTSG
ncbi:hypothetical protein ACQEU8_19230 [Streptomyces sp. CA-250714]|uniref:hypothetical protein n=1 Tax=Streptomyces sp. CA-250714 TaxID=3240060 RepID=UPI003D91648F